MRQRVALFVIGMLAAGANAASRDVVRVAQDVYALQSGAEIARDSFPARVGVVVGPRGVALIDSGISYRDGVAVLAAVRRITRRPIRFAILTHPGQEAIFGASAYQAQGIPVIMHRETAALMASRCATCLANLQAALGPDAMSDTRVIVPDRTLAQGARLSGIGRALRVIAPSRSSAPGALAVLDERSSTLFTGSIVSIRSVPDTRDGDAAGWREALVTLRATHCRHLVPSHGSLGSCRDIDAFAGYLAELDARIAVLLRDGVGLAQVDGRADLPTYEGWDRYAELHRANANRAYLRQERAAFDAAP